MKVLVETPFSSSSGRGYESKTCAYTIAHTWTLWSLMAIVCPSVSSCQSPEFCDEELPVVTRAECSLPRIPPDRPVPAGTSITG